MPLSDDQLKQIVEQSLPGYRFLGSATAAPDSAGPRPGISVATTPSLSAIRTFYSPSKGVLSRFATSIRNLFGNIGTASDADEVMVLVEPSGPLEPGEKPHVKAVIISQNAKKITSIQG